MALIMPTSWIGECMESAPCSGDHLTTPVGRSCRPQANQTFSATRLAMIQIDTNRSAEGAGMMTLEVKRNATR